MPGTVPCGGLQTAGALLFEWRGWGLNSPPPPTDQTESPSSPVRAVGPRSQSRCWNPGASTWNAGLNYKQQQRQQQLGAHVRQRLLRLAAAPVRSLPTHSLAPGRRQFCGPGGSSQALCERASQPWMSGRPTPSPTSPPQVTPPPAAGQTSCTRAWPARSGGPAAL